MMKVVYSEMDTPAGISCRLEAAGHAGYAPAGRDIVCAGASTVMQGLVCLLAGEESARNDAFDEPDGPRLAVQADAPCAEWVQGAFELAKACFALLAERYPENVRFADVSRRGEKSMMDLQLFADAGTLVNAGGNYVNAYTGEKTAFPEGGGMTASMKTFYDTELLENARPELIHTQFARKQVLPAGRGKTVEWRKWNTLEDAGALTEGVIPTGQKFGQSAVTQAVTQYGTYVSVSDQLELHAIDDVILGAAEELGASAGTTQDKLVRNVVVAGTNVQYCDKVGTNGAHTAVTSRAGLDTTAKLTPDEVNKAVTLLKKLKAPKIDGKYVAIIHPSVAYDLRSSDAWVEAHKYAGITELFTGEIGELHGVRFIETTEAKVFNGEGCPVKTAADESNGTPAEYYSVYATLFLGKDAYGMIDPEGGNMEMIIKDKGQVGGPLNQFSTLGYKFSSAAKILYEDRMVRVESCGAYSAEDEAN